MSTLFSLFSQICRSADLPGRPLPGRVVLPCGHSGATSVRPRARESSVTGVVGAFSVRQGRQDASRIPSALSGSMRLRMNFALEHAFRISSSISKAELKGRKRFDGRAAQVQSSSEQFNQTHIGEFATGGHLPSDPSFDKQLPEERRRHCACRHPRVYRQSRMELCHHPQPHRCDPLPSGLASAVQFTRSATALIGYT
jgi:hypothetical protein